MRRKKLKPTIDPDVQAAEYRADNGSRFIIFFQGWSWGVIASHGNRRWFMISNGFVRTFKQAVDVLNTFAKEHNTEIRELR